MAENLYRTVTKEEREAAWAECRMMYQHDMASMREDARKAGLAEGHAEGRSEGEAIGLEKGAAQEKREIAKSMKAKSIPNADIAEITGLSAEEVETL